MVPHTDRVDEEKIEDRCDELRQKLLAESSSGDRSSRGGGGRGMPPPPRKSFKAHQVHEMANAKIKESERLRQALKISKDYEEGGHWRRQQGERLKKSLDKDAEEDKRDAEDPRR